MDDLRTRIEALIVQWEQIVAKAQGPMEHIVAQNCLTDLQGLLEEPATVDKSYKEVRTELVSEDAEWFDGIGWLVPGQLPSWIDEYEEWSGI